MDNTSRALHNLAMSPSLDWTAYCAHSTAGRIASANAVFLDLIGYSREELAHDQVPSLLELTPPEHQSRDARNYRRAFETPKNQCWHKPLRLRGGDMILVFVVTHRTTDDLLLTLFFPVTENAEEGSMPARLLRRDDAHKRDLARKLHDMTAQNLAATAINLSLLPTLPPGDPRGQELLAECASLTSECLLEVRSISYQLYPPLLDELGLPSALRAYIHTYSRHTGIEVYLESSPNYTRPSLDVEQSLFRIVQERLTYLERQGDATECRIELACTPEQRRMTLWDNGDPDVAASENHQAELRLSISILYERAKSVGASLTIENGSRSTTIRAIIARS